jgi:hypothetical protein
MEKIMKYQILKHKDDDAVYFVDEDRKKVDPFDVLQNGGRVVRKEELVNFRDGGLLYPFYHSVDVWIEYD